MKKYPLTMKGATQLLKDSLNDKTISAAVRCAIQVVLLHLTKEPAPTILQLAGEIWRDIRGYEGDYQVSNFGRIKSFKNGVAKILSVITRGLYQVVSLHKNGKGKMFLVHRLVAQAFLPNPDNLPEVDHLNGDKTDNRVENLEWVTYSENSKRAFQNGQHAPIRGEKHVKAKLTNEQANYIRENPDNLTRKQLAERFNVHVNTIYRIQKMLTYKD